MSKRYGRNQKRKHREKIAQLHEAQKLDSQLLRHQGQVIDALKSRIENVARLIGVDSVALEPRLKSFISQSAARNFRAISLLGSVLPMKMMQTEVRKSPAHYPQDMIHFRAIIDDELVGYSISELALRNAPIDWIVRRIADEMAEMLIAQVRKNQGVASMTSMERQHESQRRAAGN